MLVSRNEIASLIPHLLCYLISNGLSKCFSFLLRRQRRRKPIFGKYTSGALTKVACRLQDDRGPYFLEGNSVTFLPIQRSAYFDRNCDLAFARYLRVPQYHYLLLFCGYY